MRLELLPPRDEPLRAELRRDEDPELRDDEPLPLFELRERLLLAFDDDPDALLRAVVAVRFAAVLPLERAVDAVFFAAVDPLLAAVLAVLPAVEAALRPLVAALRAVERAPPDEPFDELRDDERREPPERDDDDERDEDDEREDDERDREDDAALRSFAGISLLTTSLVSRGICFPT